MKSKSLNSISLPPPPPPSATFAVFFFLIDTRVGETFILSVIFARPGSSSPSFFLRGLDTKLYFSTPS